MRLHARRCGHTSLEVFAMSRPLSILFATAALALLGASAAQAWHLDGRIYCDGNGLPLPGVTINVVSTDGAGFAGSGVSDADGYYFVGLPDTPGAYMASASVLPDEVVIVPPSNVLEFVTTETEFEFTHDWVVASPRCANEKCWLTGGGARFSAITDSELGQAGKDKRHNWGGNVYPGCSPTAGDGGQWNDISDDQRLHFQGFAIEVLRCGNVDGIPPGSTSPETPFNFIEFQGTGRVQGVRGNKESYDPVYFFGRCEDRNEPGSNGQRDGAGKDRYFLNVFTDAGDPVGSSLILVDDDGNPATVDPLIITDGNLQIHVSSCDTPPTTTTLTRAASLPVTGPVDGPALGEVSLAAIMPNPAIEMARVRFSLPMADAVSLKVFDVTGREVSTLVDGALPAGGHTASWNLRDAAGRPVSGGVYFVRLLAGATQLTRSVSVAR
jgi:hypothetical protein